MHQPFLEASVFGRETNYSAQPEFALHRCESFCQFGDKCSIASSLLQGTRPIECVGLSSQAGNKVNELGLFVPLS